MLYDLVVFSEDLICAYYLVQARFLKHQFAHYEHDSPLGVLSRLFVLIFGPAKLVSMANALVTKQVL